MVMRVPIGGYLARRRPVPQPVGREHLRALSRASHRLSVERGRCGGPAAHRDPLRRSGDVPRAQAPVSPDVQQGRVPGPRLHDSVRQGRLSTRGHDVVVVTWGALVQRVAACRAAGREARRARRRARSAHHRSRTTGTPSRRIVQRTNRVVVAHEDQLTCGFGAEIAARIAGELFAHLDAPVRRVGALDTPVAYSPEPRRGHPAAGTPTSSPPSAKRRRTDRSRHRAAE